MSVSLQFCPFCQIACSVALPVLWVAPSQFVGWNVFQSWESEGTPQCHLSKKQDPTVTRPY